MVFYSISWWGSPTESRRAGSCYRQVLIDVYERALDLQDPGSLAIDRGTPQPECTRCLTVQRGALDVDGRRCLDLHRATLDGNGSPRLQREVALHRDAQLIGR